MEIFVEQQDHKGDAKLFRSHAKIVDYSNSKMTNINTVEDALDFLQDSKAGINNIGVKKGVGNNSIVSTNTVTEDEGVAMEGAVAIGAGTRAQSYNTVLGKYNKVPDAAKASAQLGDLFVLGNGVSNESRSNAFRVTTLGNAFVMGKYNTGGADFAEMYEWIDRNPSGEDRRGLFVTLDGEHIKPAKNGDCIVGAISAVPCLVGNNPDFWHGKYMTDVFGVPILEKVITIKDGERIEDVRIKINPDYDDSTDYTPRSERKEYSYVGQLGKIVVIDDGTCEVNHNCNAGKDGIATKNENGWRVLKRIDKNHVQILFFLK